MEGQVRSIPAVLAAASPRRGVGRRRTGFGLRAGHRDRQCAGQLSSCVECREGSRGNRGAAGDAGLTGVVLEAGNGRGA